MASVNKLIVFIAIIFPIFMVYAKDNPMSQPWFSHSDCDEIRLRKLKSLSDDKVISEVIIRDKSAIKNFMERINAIPAQGDEMKSFGSEAEHVELVFSFSNNQKNQIDIINRRFKTPSTGFNSDDNEVEASLYRDIEGLLFPDIEKIILKIENLELHFGSFSITYLNTDHIPQKPDGPTIGPVYVMNFLLQDTMLKKETKLASRSAQIPPQPVNFEVNGKQYILLTYQSINQERLYPQYFQVIENQALSFDSYVP